MLTIYLWSQTNLERVKSENISSMDWNKFKRMKSEKTIHGVGRYHTFIYNPHEYWIALKTFYNYDTIWVIQHP